MSARLLWALLMPVLTQLSRLPWIAGMMLGNAISGVSVGLTALLEEFACWQALPPISHHSLPLSVCSSMTQHCAVLCCAGPDFCEGRVGQVWDNRSGSAAKLQGCACREGQDRAAAGAGGDAMGGGAGGAAALRARGADAHPEPDECSGHLCPFLVRLSDHSLKGFCRPALACARMCA